MGTVTIKVSGMPDVKLTNREYLELVNALKKMIMWDVGGMYGDGGEIIDKAGFKRAKTVLGKLSFS